MAWEPVTNTGLFEERREAFLTGFEGTARSVLLDSVRDPVRQDRVPARPALLLQVLRDAGGDRAAHDLLVARVENEREVGVVLTDRFEELDPVRLGHLVIGDDTVDIASRQDVDGFVGGRRRQNRQPVVLTLEIHRNGITEIRVVVDVEDVNRVGRGRHALERITRS